MGAPKIQSEYLTMRLCLAEVAWQEAIEGICNLKTRDKLKQLKKIELLAWEVEKLKEGRI